MKRKRLIMDACLSACLSLSLLMTVYAFTGAELPAIWQLMWQALWTSTAVVLITRKKELAAALAGLVFLAALVWSLLGDPLAWIRDALGRGTDQTAWFFTLLALAASSLSFLFFRRLFQVIAALAVNLLLLAGAFVNQTAYTFPLLGLTLFGLLVSLAGAYGAAQAKGMKEVVADARFYHRLTAAVMAGLILLLSFWIAPREDGHWQASWLIRLVEDVSSLLALDSRQLATGSLFKLADVGYQPLGDRLGGDVTADHTVVLDVVCQKPGLLKGTVYTTYDGKRWTNPQALTRYRYGSLLLSGHQRHIFEPVWLFDNRYKTAAVTTRDTLAVSSRQAERSVFIPGIPLDIQAENFDRHLLSFNQQGTVFFADGGRKGRKVIVDALWIDRSAPDADRLLLGLEAQMASQKDPRAPDKEALLALPENLPASVYELAQDLTTSQRSAYAKARSIENWLSTHMTYTLTPGEPPEEADFVAAFLESRAGYCVYFASAMTVLARCAGLPARYVTGYALHQEADRLSDQSYVATRMSAHAWAEVYLHGLGWLVFDPSGALARPYYAKEGDLEKPPVTPPPAQQVPKEESDGSVGERLDPEGGKRPWRLVWIVLALMLLAVVPVVGHLGPRFGSKRLKKRFDRRFPNPTDRLMRLFKRSQEQVSWLGFELLPTETLAEYLDRVKNVDGLRGLNDAWLPVIHWLYGDVTPAEADVQTLWALCLRFEETLHQQWGVWRYGFRRLFRFGS